MRLGRLPAPVSDERTVWGQCQDLAHGDLRLVPFEDENPIGREYPEALGESKREVVPPVERIELPVLLPHPCVVANSDEMRRVEHDHPE